MKSERWLSSPAGFDTGQNICFWKNIWGCGPYSTSAGRIETSERVKVAT